VAELPALPRVKVCGLTSIGDALAAVDAGCDAIGLVAHRASPRAVRADRAAEIAASVGGRALVVAVLVDVDPEGALAVCEAFGARAVQLCGGEIASAWRDFPLPILRRIAVEPGAREAIEAWRGTAALSVLDHPSAPGGSGREVDLGLAAELARVAPCSLAGGLDQANVAERVRAVRPFGVDASSRLETAPGRKDAAKVRVFVARARAALAEART
jgi:phosphoribosylanthranilate isomerase